MSSLIDYKGLQVVRPDPSAAGGLAIQEDLKSLVDWNPKSVWDKTADPTADDDVDDDFYPGSRWFNTTSGALFVCVDNTSGAAVWTQVTGGSGTPGGSNTQVQFNNSGAFGGDANFTWNESTDVLTVAGQANVDNLRLDGNTLSSTNTNGPVIITPNANGAIQVDTGGNGRGTNAVDFQSTRSAASQVASGQRSFIAGGIDNTASGLFSHAEGEDTTASGRNSHAEGIGSTASGYWAAHAEGSGTIASDDFTHAEGMLSVASGPGSHAEGASVASGVASHAEGGYTTASGYYSHSEGTNTAASGLGSHSEGIYAVASGGAAHAGGQRSKAHLLAQWSRASGGHSDEVGTAQSTQTSLFRRTTDATATELTLGGGAPGSTTRFTILDGQTLSCLINIVGRKENGSTNDHASFLRQVLIRREGSTTALVGAVQTVGTDINPAGWGGVTIAADDTNESLKISVTGAASTNIRWTATVLASEAADAAI